MGMISDLPDHMLPEILSWLPAREVVATMLLSRRWKFLWKQVSKFDYNFSQNDGKDFSFFFAFAMNEKSYPTQDLIRKWNSTLG